MGKIIDVYKNKRIQLSSNEVSDINTGEIFKLSKDSINEGIKTGEIMIDYKNYFTLDMESLNILLGNKIKQVELALLISIANNLMLGFNICLDSEDNPHTTESISFLVGNTVQATKKKLNSLILSGLLFYGILPKKKRLGKVYIINPHVLKKGKKLDKNIAPLFNDVQ